MPASPWFRINRYYRGFHDDLQSPVWQFQNTAMRLPLMSLILAVILALLGGCHALRTYTTSPAPTATDTASFKGFYAINGQVTMAAPEGPAAFRIAAIIGQFVTSATVTLADLNGFALASGVTDATGNFTIVPSGFVPAAGNHYLLDAGKNLGGATPGKAMARFRTLLQWTGAGWLSISNAAQTGPVVLNPLTTAVAIISALDPTNVSAASTMGRVNGSTDPATLTGSPFTAHPDAEINNLATSIVTYLAADLDPLATVTAIVPAIASTSVTAGKPSDLVVLAGQGFVPNPAGNSVLFGTATASVYLATPRIIVVEVPLGVSGSGVKVITAFGTTNTQPFTVGSTTVTIDPNGFAGSWTILGESAGWQTGRRLVDLLPGRSYTWQVNGGGTYSFALGTDGIVSSGSGPAIGANRLLQFTTVPVIIKPNGTPLPWAIDYVGTAQSSEQAISLLKTGAYTLRLSGATTWLGGDQTVRLLGQVTYTLKLSGASNAIVFSVDGAGNVTTSGASATGGPGQVNLSLQNVTINRNGYEGAWALSGIGALQNFLDGVIPLVKGQTYALYPNSGNLQNGINFTVDSTGQVVVYGNSATGGAGTLALATASVAVNTNGWAGTWQLEGLPKMLGSQTLTLVKGFTYTLFPSPSVSYWRIVFSFDAVGVASSGTTHTGGAGTLAFNTVMTTVTTAAGNQWNLPYADGVSRAGAVTISLLKGLNYSINASSGGYVQTFDINAAGNASPASFNLGSAAYTVSP